MYSRLPRAVSTVASSRRRRPTQDVGRTDRSGAEEQEAANSFGRCESPARLYPTPVNAMGLHPRTSSVMNPRAEGMLSGGSEAMSPFSEVEHSRELEEGRVISDVADCKICERTCQRLTFWKLWTRNVIYWWNRLIRSKVVVLGLRVAILDNHCLGSDPRKQYFVASGSFGEVCRIRMRCGRVFAVKIPYLSDTQARQSEEGIKEARVWLTLHHRNINPLIGVVTTPAHDRVCFVSPLVPMGNVNHYLRNTTDKTSIDKMKLIRGIAEAVHYLHSQNPPVVHGDLKADNVLVSQDGEALLTDFGAAVFFTEARSSRAKDSVPKLYQPNAMWAPPERLNPLHYGTTWEGSFTPAGDVFSMGRTFLEILSGDVPFKRVVQAKVLMLVAPEPPALPQHPDHPGEEAFRRGMTAELWAIILKCWATSREDRPTSEDVVNFLSGHPPVERKLLHCAGVSYTMISTLTRSFKTVSNVQRLARWAGLPFVHFGMACAALIMAIDPFPIVGPCKKRYCSLSGQVKAHKHT